MSGADYNWDPFTYVGEFDSPTLGRGWHLHGLSNGQTIRVEGADCSCPKQIKIVSKTPTFSCRIVSIDEDAK